MQKTAKQKVAAGIKFLNRYAPKNRLRKIKVTRLNLQSAENCMLGQIYGSYEKGCNVLREIRPVFDDMLKGASYRQERGFTCAGWVEDPEWDQLNDAWRTAIRAQKKAA